MDQEIFQDWFFNIFVKKVKFFLKKNNLPKKAMLILDNCPAHTQGLQTKDGNIFCIFLPNNMTARLQPMDDGILNAIKIRYRKNLLRNILSIENDDATIVDLLKLLSLKDVVFMLAESWKEVNSESLKKNLTGH